MLQLVSDKYSITDYKDKKLHEIYWFIFETKFKKIYISCLQKGKSLIRYYVLSFILKSKQF